MNTKFVFIFFEISWLIKIKINVMTNTKTKLPPLPKKWFDLVYNSKNYLLQLYCIDNFELPEHIINKWFLHGEYEICKAILSKYKNDILTEYIEKLFRRGDKEICSLLLSYFTGNLLNDAINDIFQKVGCNIPEEDLIAKCASDFRDYSHWGVSSNYSGSDLYDSIIKTNIPFCDFLLRKCSEKISKDSIYSVFLGGGYRMREFLLQNYRNRVPEELAYDFFKKQSK